MSNIISAALIVASVGLFFTYINPKYSNETGSTVFAEKSIKELKSDEEQYSTALTKTREISEIQSRLLRDFNSISKENRDELSKLLPSHVDTVRLIIDIQRIVDRHDMTLENISVKSIGNVSNPEAAGVEGVTLPQISASGLPYDSVGMTFTVNGSYETFLEFIRDLENSLRIIDIVALSFNAPSDAKSGYSFTFDIQTYFLKK